MRKRADEKAEREFTAQIQDMELKKLKHKKPLYVQKEKEFEVSL